MAENVQESIKHKTSFPALWSLLDFEREKIYMFIISRESYTIISRESYTQLYFKNVLPQ
jgi:hypothetical protein